MREVVPVGRPDAGDLRVSIAVVCGLFAGRNESVWIDAARWEHFAHELYALERTRRGEATLASMSPEELRLRLFASDRAGHMGVEGHVGELDPGLLPRLAREAGAFPATL